MMMKPSPPRGAVELGDDQPTHSHVLAPRVGLVHCVATYAPIHHQQCLVGSLEEDEGEQ